MKVTKKIKVKFSGGIRLLLIAVFFISLLPNSASASDITESNVFNATNNERGGNGVAGLAWNYKLAQAARNKAQDMVDKDYFSHNTPDGRTPWSFITAVGYNYIYAGENLAMNFTDTESMMSQWMASGGHRANILGSQFKELGVGVVVGEFQGYTTTMVVQMFGTQAAEVYGDNNNPSSGSHSSSHSSQPSSSNREPDPPFDPSTVTTPSIKLIQRRIEDFRKTTDYLVKIVRKDKK